MHASVLALPVTHPDHRDIPLWLLVCRSKGRTPWYLLTAAPITTDENAWRFDKSELAFQRPRLWHWLALTPGQGPALPPALCTQSLVATLSTLLCCLGQATPRACPHASTPQLLSDHPLSFLLLASLLLDNVLLFCLFPTS